MNPTDSKTYAAGLVCGFVAGFLVAAAGAVALLMLLAGVMG